MIVGSLPQSCVETGFSTPCWSIISIVRFAPYCNAFDETNSVTVNPKPNGLYNARRVRLVTPDIGARTMGGQISTAPMRSGATAGGITPTSPQNAVRILGTPRVEKHSAAARLRAPT